MEHDGKGYLAQQCDLKSWNLPWKILVGSKPPCEYQKPETVSSWDARGGSGGGHKGGGGEKTPLVSSRP